MTTHKTTDQITEPSSEAPNGDVHAMLEAAMAILTEVRAAQDAQVVNARVPGERIQLRVLACKVIEHMSASTARNYKTYILLLVDGTEVLVNGKPYAGLGDSWTDEITKEDLLVAKQYVLARAMLRINDRATNRASVGRAVRESDGEGAWRNAVAAWRHLFAAAVDNHHLHSTLNPTVTLKRPPQNKQARWGLESTRVADLLDLVGSTGDDPTLDRHIVETIVIAGARDEGILNLRLKDIDLEESALFLREKNASKEWQPVPPSLARALHAFALSRGATHPDDPVFRKRAIGKRPATPITERRFDYIFCDRVQPSLPWADKEQVTAHTLRHTAITLIERTAGKAVGAAFARHKPRDVTDVYAKASRREVAAAVCRLWSDETHPWEDRQPCLRR